MAAGCRYFGSSEDVVEVPPVPGDWACCEAPLHEAVAKKSHFEWMLAGDDRDSSKAWLMNVKDTLVGLLHGVLHDPTWKCRSDLDSDDVIRLQWWKQKAGLPVWLQ